MTCLSPLGPAAADASDDPSASVGAVKPRTGRDFWWVGLGALGALLLSVPGFRYRIDAVNCAVWPALGPRMLYAATYLLALLLLTLAWLKLLGRAQQPDGPGGRRILLYAAVINGAALLSPPFLSDDPLFYAAIGRVLAGFGGSAYAPLCRTLPPGDWFLTVLTPAWQCGTSAYFPGFHALAWGIGTLGGGSLTLHLRLYQLLGAAVVLLTAWVTGAALAAADRATDEPGNGGRRSPWQRPAAGIALIALNPLCVIEASVNAHNDVLLALGCAAATYFIVRGRPQRAVLVLLASLLIKASAAVLLGMAALAFCFAALRRRFAALTGWLPRAGRWAVVAAIVFIALVRFRIGGLNTFTALVGSPADPFDYCTRSIECLPRVILRFILHRPTAAWKIGLFFRVLGAAWLGACAWRAGRRPLAWLATGLFIYYLYLHGWAQSWYLLSLLPLVPFASAATRPAMLTFCVSGCAYYGGFLIGGCVEENLDRGVVDLIEGLCTVVPPSVALWRYRNRTDV